MLVLTLVTALAAVPDAGALAAGSPASARAAGGNDTCYDIVYIAARGSDETMTDFDGLGRELAVAWHVIEREAKSDGLSYTFKAVDTAGGEKYTADSVEEMIPNHRQLAKIALAYFGAGRGTAARAAALATYLDTNVKPYLESIERGIRVTKKLVAEEVARCPASRLILAGYSQGAIAVHDAENDLARSTDPATRGLLDHVVGTLLLGDPDRVANTKAKIFGSAPRAGSGLRVGLGLVRGRDVALPASTAEVQGKHDIVGDFSSWTLGGSGSVAAGVIALAIPNDLLKAAAFYALWSSKVQPRLEAAKNVHTSYTKDGPGKDALTSAAEWIASRFAPPPPLQLGPVTRDPWRSQLNGDGRILLVDEGCHGSVWTVGSEFQNAKPVGDDGICFKNLLSGPGTQVAYAQYDRNSLVPDTQPDCPDPLGYMYLKDMSGTTNWIDLNGGCLYQYYRISPNARFLATTEGVNGQHLVLHDLRQGTATEITTDLCDRRSGEAFCAPYAVTNDGSQVIFEGLVPNVDSSGHVSTSDHEPALFLWKRGVGATQLAGGDAASYLHVLAASGDATTVLYVNHQGGSQQAFYRWTPDQGSVEVLTGETVLTPVSASVSDDGATILVSYPTRDDAGHYTLAVSIARGGSTAFDRLADLGLAPPDAREAVVSGDGRTIAFVSDEALLPEDVYSTANWYVAHLPG